MSRFPETDLRGFADEICAPARGFPGTVSYRQARVRLRAPRLFLMVASELAEVTYSFTARELSNGEKKRLLRWFSSPGICHCQSLPARAENKSARPSARASRHLWAGWPSAQRQVLLSEESGLSRTRACPRPRVANMPAHPWPSDRPAPALASTSGEPTGHSDVNGTGRRVLVWWGCFLHPLPGPAPGTHPEGIRAPPTHQSDFPRLAHYACHVPQRPSPHCLLACTGPAAAVSRPAAACWVSPAAQ